MDQVEKSMTSKKSDWNFRIVNYFLHQPQLTLLFLILLVVLGVGSFARLRVEGFPKVEVPIAVVRTVLPGAGPETIDATITQPLESALSNLDGLESTQGTSQTNASILVLNFGENVDLNNAVQEVRTKLASVELPAGTVSPEVTIPETGGADFIVAVTGGTDLISLRNAAADLSVNILAIDKVSSFTDVSGIEEKIFIDLPPQFMQPGIVDQIRAANLGFPLGEALIDGKSIPVVSKSDLDSLEAVRKININMPDGSQKLLADIAQVYLGTETAGKVHRVGFLDSESNQFKIQPGVLYAVKLDVDADILQVNKELKAVLQSVELPNGIDAAIVLNQGDNAEEQVQEILSGAIGGKWGDGNPLGYVGFLFGGVWLLLIAMLLFLDWKTALISVLAIPLSFFSTFLVLNLAGIQLNTLVLFSLVLVLGLIVDPAIVVLESIRRYVDIGLRGKEAVLRSITVIGLGLFVAVLTSVIVFVPFGVVSGTFGKIISYIPWTVFPALIASYFVPLIFLTWLGAKYIQPEVGQELRDEDDIHTLWPLARWFISVNTKILSNRTAQIIVVSAALIIPIIISVSLFVSGSVRQVQFSQPDDSQYLSLTVPLPSNQSYRDLLITATGVENILKNYAGNIQSFYYQSQNNRGSGSDLTVSVVLLPRQQRSVTALELTKDLQSDLREKFGQLSSASILASGPPVNTYPVSIKIFDSDPMKLKEASRKLSIELDSYQEVDVIKTDYTSVSSELSIRVDEEKAKALGLSKQAILGQVAGLLGESNLYRVGNNEVVLRIPDDTKPNSQETLLASLINGNSGPVPLRDVASVSIVEAPSSIRSINGERYAEVDAKVLDARDGISVQRKISQWAKDNTEVLGVNSRAFDDRVGSNEFEKSFQELFLAILLAIIASYVAFVIFFKSFAQPFIILFAIPLVLIGVFPALAILAGGQFGFLEIIGILMVIGIVENVGIFLIDYANKKVADGMNKKDAISLASGIRLRAIILTKVTALAGLLPLAVFSPFWRGLSVVVIFGILSSGILSLFTTPVLYSWLTRTKNSGGSENNEFPLVGAVNSNARPTTLPPNLLL